MKKGVKKKSSRKKPSIIREHKSPKEINIERALVENFIELQKVMSHMSVNFNELTKEIKNLLKLFEDSAKSLAEKDVTMEQTGRNDKEIIKKIDGLMDQNKIIAKGLVMIHGNQNQPQQKNIQPKIPQEEGSDDLSGYTKSISSPKK
ncbi:hypothetical protein J4481_00745 [Candidatus Pacearchaeota archaeon]|nr:hypothetical protein [Candidatus Pacearchaeota archaeon]